MAATIVAVTLKDGIQHHIKLAGPHPAVDELIAGLVDAEWLVFEDVDGPRTHCFPRGHVAHVEFMSADAVPVPFPNRLAARSGGA